MTALIELQYASDTAGVPSRSALRRYARAALAGRRDEAELTVRVVDEAESAGLNETYRGKQGPTNVLSFPFEAPPELALSLIGDVVICAPVVAREAAAQGKPRDAHWAHMIVHGVLHLLGYDHQDTSSAAEMEALEISILAQLGYPNPYLPSTS